MTVKEKILKILALCLEINPPEIEDIGQKKTAVFLNWSPHCNVLHVYVHWHGWKPHKDWEIDFHLNVWREPEKLDEIIIVLKEILEGEKTNESV